MGGPCWFAAFSWSCVAHGMAVALLAHHYGGQPSGAQTQGLPVGAREGFSVSYEPAGEVGTDLLSGEIASGEAVSQDREAVVQNQIEVDKIVALSLNPQEQSKKPVKAKVSESLPGKRKVAMPVPVVAKAMLAPHQTGAGQGDSTDPFGSAQGTILQGTIGDLGSGDGWRGAAVVVAPKPPYPRLARLDGFEGRVILTVGIAADGRVAHAQVSESSGRKDCDFAATKTLLESWRFEPATKFGIPVASEKRIAVRYALR